MTARFLAARLTNRPTTEYTGLANGGKPGILGASGQAGSVVNLCSARVLRAAKKPPRGPGPRRRRVDGMYVNPLTD